MKKNVFYFLGIILMMVSCYPDEPEYYEDLDVVYTNYTQDFDFVSKATYSMPDKIVKVEGNLIEDEVPEFVQEPYNSQVLQKIESNMAAMGWTKVDIADNPDLVLLPAVWTNTTVIYYYDYWCWYYPYYCGWGYYYPVSASSYTTGTLIMALVANGENYVEPSGVWYAAANGILTGEYNTSRVMKAIDQAFEQSPYLNTK
jgi:hypothetical protein